MAVISALRYCAESLRFAIKAILPPANGRKPPPHARRWELDAAQTAAIHRGLGSESPEPDVVDDRTWSELELDKVLVRLDKSVTPLGSQYLFALLRNYQSAREPLEENVSAYRALVSNPEACRSLRMALADLNCNESAGLADFLLGPPLAAPAGYGSFYLISAAALVCPFGLLISG